MSYDIALIRSNSVSHDPRVEKIMQSLSKKYNVIVLCWDRENINKSFEFFNKNVLIKRLKLWAPFGRVQLIFYYPFFWIWVLFNLFVYRPKIIHSCDFDTLIPSYLFKILFSTTLVSDNFDRYAMAFIPTKYQIIYACVNIFEAVLTSKTDVLITVSKKRLSTFGKYKPKCSEVIMNCSEDTSDSIHLTRISTTQMNNDLVLVYAGGIARGRGLLLVEKALQNIEATRLIIAGRICDDVLEELVQNQNVHYVGLLKHNEALNLQRSADIIPILYDPDIPINRVANPNKLFEAMMLGVPVITNVCVDMVNQVGCGLIVDYNTESVKSAILRLQNDPLLRAKMGKNGRYAYEKNCNWALMEKKLLKIYSKFLQEP
ncbi:MAG: glycosyltransferase [Dehalococcoidia bacterium]|nr:MAG: glycosyltransferase [Dehalococcoidia bacterium]